MYRKKRDMYLIALSNARNRLKNYFGGLISQKEKFFRRYNGVL